MSPTHHIAIASSSEPKAPPIAKRPLYSGTFTLKGLGIDDIAPRVQRLLFERIGERRASWTAREVSGSRSPEGVTNYITWEIEWEAWEWEYQS